MLEFIKNNLLKRKEKKKKKKTEETSWASVLCITENNREWINLIIVNSETIPSGPRKVDQEKNRMQKRNEHSKNKQIY